MENIIIKLEPTMGLPRWALGPTKVAAPPSGGGGPRRRKGGGSPPAEP